jgi:hypothetical protein
LAIDSDARSPYSWRSRARGVVQADAAARRCGRQARSIIGDLDHQVAGDAPGGQPDRSAILGRTGAMAHRILHDRLQAHARDHRVEVDANPHPRPIAFHGRAA